MKKKLLVIAAIVIVIAGGVGAYLIKGHSTPASEKAAQSFMHSMLVGDYTTAYGYMSPTAKEKLTQAQFNSDAQQSFGNNYKNAQTALVGASLPNKHMFYAGSTYVVGGNVPMKNVMIDMTQSGSTWQVDKIKVDND